MTSFSTEYPLLSWVYGPCQEPLVRNERRPPKPAELQRFKVPADTAEPRILPALLQNRQTGRYISHKLASSTLLAMAQLSSPWYIGDVEIPSRIVLAPMAGVSVQAFRRQGRRFGAGLVCSEMVSACGLSYGNARTLGYLRIARDEHPLAVQVFGSDPATVADAARMCQAAGADIIDVNFGCPVRKVTKTGAGASALDNHEVAISITRAIADAVSVPVTVKLRA